MQANLKLVGTFDAAIESGRERTTLLLDTRLAPLQIVALRFASDGEFAELARRAAEQNLDPKDIKKSVKHWRPDTYRV